MSIGTARRRAHLAMALIATLAASLVIVATPTIGQAAPGFRPGMIISDAVFYNASAMSAPEIQSFLNAKGASCVVGSTGTPCLKDFRQSTWTRPADSRCTQTYSGAPNESAATIIAKVAVACRINPQVLLVLLQKEQSLVTASGSYLTSRRYEAATGYGCPDTAPCDAEYRGFYNQVYKAAWQFRGYALNPYNFAHVPHRTSQTVRLHPNATCGSVGVYIENQATASLYNYTPYTANRALLAGGSDACSSYGNYNFHTFFTEWFGSTEFATIGAIDVYWRANQAKLGAATGPEFGGLRAGGVVQAFQQASVYWTPATGARSVRGGILDMWGWQRWENGPLGYPISDERILSRLNGAVQSFEGGHIYWSPVGGPQVVSGAMVGVWSSMGWENGVLGYPISAEFRLRDGGAVQSFEGGPVYWSPAGGARAVRGGILVLWSSMGWENGLGYPISNEFSLRSGGAVQSFERGAIYWTPMYGPKSVSGAILTYWGANGWENGRLGYPTSNEISTGATAYQTFENGRITFTHATGRVTVTYTR